MVSALMRRLKLLAVLLIFNESWASRPSLTRPDSLTPSKFIVTGIGRGGWIGKRTLQKDTKDNGLNRRDRSLGETKGTVSNQDSSQCKKQPSLATKLSYAGIGIASIFILVEYAENIAAYLASIKPEWFDMELFKANLLERLTDVNENGGTKGLLLYICFLCIWGALGLTTVPVESAAGMAFGPKALGLNAAGKMLASLAAYTIGRLFLEEYVVSKLDENEIFGLVEKSVAKKPFRTSLLVRLGPFPELAKNLGLAVLPPCGFLTFALATFAHTFPFTCLWTWLGCDSMLHLRDSALPPNALLGAILVFVTIFGIVGSPALIAWWIRDMKLEHDKAL